MKAKRVPYKLVTLDFETDPFAHGARIRPFCWDLFTGSEHVTYWGDDCVERLIGYLKSIKRKLVIYGHNGGKFDFLFLLKWIRGKNMLLIQNRIVEAELCGHLIRDSLSAIPVPLRVMEKDDIDYSKMGERVRLRHRPEIVRYLHKDTESLYKYISAYREMFGHKAVTMASAAIRELKKFHSYEVMSENTDALFRPFFHGGRVECFRTGLIQEPLKVFDVNSMYPSVMRDFLHPVSAFPIPSTNGRIYKKTCFVEWEGISHGAMPHKDKKGALSFPHGAGIWLCSIHEFDAGLVTGTIEPKKILRTWEFLERRSFREFIEHYYTRRLEAKANGDAVNALFYKLVMNSAYGKFAQNPRDFQDYRFTGELTGGRWESPGKECWCPNAPECKCNGWRIACEPAEGYMLWCRPAQRKADQYGIWHGFHNVATAASITGAARSLLWKAIVQADTPVYCDTDSLICKDLGPGTMQHPKDLGAWKLEMEGVAAAIAGKKTYAVFAPGVPQREEKEPESKYRERVAAAKWGTLYAHKMAHKGVRLTAAQIVEVATGGEVEYASPVPTMRLDGSQKYITRRIRKTS